jgi:hypothetical protein
MHRMYYLTFHVQHHFTHCQGDTQSLKRIESYYCNVIVELWHDARVQQQGHNHTVCHNIVYCQSHIS